MKAIRVSTLASDSDFVLAGYKLAEEAAQSWADNVGDTDLRIGCLANHYDFFVHAGVGDLCHLVGWLFYFGGMDDATLKAIRFVTDYERARETYRGVEPVLDPAAFYKRWLKRGQASSSCRRAKGQRDQYAEA